MTSLEFNALVPQEAERTPQTINREKNREKNLEIDINHPSQVKITLISFKHKLWKKVKKQGRR